MFIAAKFLDLLSQPLAWVALLLLAAVAMGGRHERQARRLSASALAALLLLGWQPLPDMLLRYLESAYTEIAPKADMHAYVGAVVLGGATEPGLLQQAHHQPLTNSAAERLTAGVALLQHNPHLRLVYTGGEGFLLGDGPSEAERARLFFDNLSVPASQVTYESASRNTRENATLTAQLPGVDPQQPWLLVTSAWHMRRSMGTFAKAGWNVTAYPVDFRTAPQTPWTAYSMNDGAERWQLALHELLGIVSYRLAGWI